MKTRLRPLTIVFSFLLLAVFGGPGLTVYFDGEPSAESDKIKATIALLFCLAGICCIIWLTLLIRIDGSSRTITLFYPFQLRIKRFHFNEVIGFRFRYLPGLIDYKALQLKMSDGQKFTVSDFETANLRELETYYLENFDLRSDKAFRELDNIEKQAEIDKSKQFDLTQLKSIRYYLWMIMLFLFVMAAALTYGMLTNPSASSTKEVVILVLLVFLCTFSVLRINKINKQLKSKAEYAGNEQS